MALTVIASTQQLKTLNVPLNANFSAIESGGSAFQPTKINLADATATPTSISGAGQVYSLVGPDSGQQELFYQDDDASPNEVQLTSAGALGADITTLKALNANIGPGSTIAIDQRGFRVGGGMMTTGTLSEGYNITAAAGSGQDLDITFDTALAAATYHVFLQRAGVNSLGNVYVDPTSRTTSGFTITGGQNDTYFLAIFGSVV